jgi:hypothetical protein
MILISVREFLNKILILALMALVFVSCEKEELAVKLPPHPLDSVSIMQISLGENYEDQVFVNFLDSNIEKARINNSSWDLAFDCMPQSNKVMINGGKGVLISVLGRGNFAKNVKLNEIKWKWDESSGGDSLALRNWCNPFDGRGFDSVYIIDRGPEIVGPGRYFQFKLDRGPVGSYSILVADLNGQILKLAEINRVPNKNQVYFDFSSLMPKSFEPNNNNWQFCFLRCRWIYYEFNPPLLYTVTGIHINPRMVTVAIDSTMEFGAIKKSMVQKLEFKNKRDVIGFEWKLYDFVQGRYTTRKYVNYIFKTMGPNPCYYKLRFTDYYSKQGIKGSPRFEVAELK